MSLIERPSPTRRRRGSELEDALLQATWDELVDKGYDAVTFEAVAERAHTSRAVLYRRWPAKTDLVLAAIGAQGFQQQVQIPDTGSLRGDMLEFMTRANDTRAHTGLTMITRLGAFYADAGTNLAALRGSFLHGRAEAIETMFERAVSRGEIDAEKLSPRVRKVAFDLYLHELMMTLQPVPPDSIHSILDDVFLPLVLKK